MPQTIAQQTDTTPMTWPEFLAAATARNPAYWAGLSPAGGANFRVIGSIREAMRARSRPEPVT